MNRRSNRSGHSVRTALATGILALSALLSIAHAQFEITVVTGSTSQDFDTLITSGTNQPWTNDTTLTLDDSTLNGWSLFTYTNVAIGDYNAGAGGSTAGKFYSFGTGTSTERALGGVGSANTYFGSPAPASGAVAGYIAFAVTNNSASTLGKFTLGFDGEQWRNGGNTSAQTMTFEYGFGTLFTDVATWTQPGGNFNWDSPVHTGTAAAVDGNAAGLVGGRGGTVNGLTWVSGQTLWLRWIELNDTGNDHGLAIDNFSLSWDMAPPAKDLLWTPTTADWNTTDTNWKDTSNNNIVAFSNGDSVTFDSSGLAQANVQVAAGGVTPNTVTVNVGALETYLISGGAINTVNANTLLQKQGVGTLELGSIYSGGLNAVAGTVKVLIDNTFGDTASVILGNNVTFDLNHHMDTIGALDLTGATITMGAGLLTVTGNITVQESPTSTPTTIDGAISVGSSGIRNLTIADSMAAEDLVINAAIAGSARISVTGPGTIRLNGDDSGYSGNFQMNTTLAPTVIVGSADTPFGTNTMFVNGGVIHAAVPLTGPDKLVNDFSLGGTGVTIEGEDVEIGGTFSFHQGASKVLQINGSTVVTLSGVIKNGDETPAPNASLAVAGTGTLVMAADGSGYTGAFQVGDSGIGGKVVLASANGLGSGPVTLYAYMPDVAELDVTVSATIGGLNSIGDGEQKVILSQGSPVDPPTILRLDPTTGDAFYGGTIAVAAGQIGGVLKDGPLAQTLSGSQDYDTLEVLDGTMILDSTLADAIITNTNGRLILNANADGSDLNADSANGVFITANQTLDDLNIGASGLVVLGTPPPAAGVQAIPEPGSFALLFAGALGLLGRRSRNVERDYIPLPAIQG